MKKLSVFALVLMFSLFTFAQNVTKVQLGGSDDNFELISKSQLSLTVMSTLSDLVLLETATNGGDFITLQNQILIKTFDVGNPNLPVISKLIEVPQDANVVINVISYDEKIIDLADYGVTNQIIPAQASVAKDVDPASVPFEINEVVYNTDAFFANEVAIYEDAGMMRATRLGRIQISPIQYNPVTNQVKILNNLVVEIKFVDANMAKTQALKTKYASPYFDDILDASVLNYSKDPHAGIIPIPHLVIVSDRMFEAQLEPFIEWKNLKGFDVTVAYTDDIGSSTTAVKSYLQGIYEGDDPMDFVLFVGDIQQIPAWSASGHVTDLRYCEYTGDNVPEVFYGRFSAQNTAQLQPQIDKTLMYEQYTMSDPSYLENQVLVAGVDGGYATVYGNGAINYISGNYANGDNGINPLTYLYGDAANSTVMASDDGGASASITSYMSQGVGWANYTAHCSPSGWADPGFEISELNTITNDEKYGLWIGNCCLSVKFDESECFGEAALRKANGGAIGDIGGSNSTYWDEDYWWATGVLAVEASSSTRKQYYWEIYHLMGDPTVMNYLGVPSEIDYTLTPAVLMIGATSVDISTGAPFALIAFHQGGQRIAVASADIDGNATVDFSSAIVGGEVTLVITAQNRQPVIDVLTPLAASEPYITVSSYTPDNANYNSTTSLDMVFENVAGADYDAANVIATLTTSDPYITIIDGTENVGTINGGESVSVTDAFSIAIANDVPDEYVAEFAMTITGDDAKYTWESSFNVVCNAPVLEVAFSDINDLDGDLTFTSTPITQIDEDVEYSYDISVLANGGNANGMFDAGETAGITVNASNTGHADLVNATCILTSTSPYVTVNTGEVYLGTIPVDGTLPAVFSVSIDAGCPVAESIELIFTLVGGEYSKILTISPSVGLQIEDFETGDFSTYNWLLSGNADWSIDGDAYEGDYSAKSGDISDNQSSDLSMTCNVTANGTISFWSKVDSESNYDYLKFYIDGAQQDAWSGEGGSWGEHSYAVTAGSHTFKWAYEKDGSVSNGADCGWVDNIIFPGHTASKGDRVVTITAPTLPSWLTFSDNGDGTAQLTGTSPSSIGLYPVELLANNGTINTPQDFNIAVGAVNLASQNNIIELYPNPTSRILNVNIDEFNTASFVLTDVVGKVVIVKDITSSKTQVDISNLAHGIYILNLNIDGVVKQEKIIVE